MNINKIIYNGYAVIITFVYVLIGVFFNVWHPTWMLFLSIPCFYMLAEMNKATGFKAKAELFPYPILCVILYLALGFDYNWWHPMWIIFLTIPLYYIAVESWKK